MVGRLHDKVALVVGAGSVGPGWGNGTGKYTGITGEWDALKGHAPNPAPDQNQWRWRPFGCARSKLLVGYG